MAGIWFYSRMKLKNRKEAFGTQSVIKRLIIGTLSENMIFGIFIFIVLLLILALVNPQYGLKREKVKVDKSDIFFVLDISASMNATDISPSRLEKSKRFLDQLIQTRKGDQLGLILFAGGAYLQMPMTTDYAAAQLFIRSATTDMAGTQGTVIGEAIDLAMRSTKEKNQKAIIIISDGEDHDSDAIDMAKKAADNGWNIYTIGVGSAEGSLIPVNVEGREEYKMDGNGNPVKSTLNVELLKSIAENGHGEYYQLGNENEDIVSDINKQLDKLKKRAVEVKSFTEYRSYYQYLLFGALLLIIIEFFFLSGIKQNDKL